MLPVFDAVPPPPLKLFPTLSINARGRVYLSRDLMERLDLRDGQRANVLPPTSPTDPCWHLDLRPKCRHKVSIYKHSRPRIESLAAPAAATPPTGPSGAVSRRPRLTAAAGANSTQWHAGRGSGVISAEGAGCRAHAVGPQNWPGLHR